MVFKNGPEAIREAEPRVEARRESRQHSRHELRNVGHRAGTHRCGRGLRRLGTVVDPAQAFEGVGFVAVEGHAHHRDDVPRRAATRTSVRTEMGAMAERVSSGKFAVVVEVASAWPHCRWPGYHVVHRCAGNALSDVADVLQCKNSRPSMTRCGETAALKRVRGTGPEFSTSSSGSAAQQPGQSRCGAPQYPGDPEGVLQVAHRRCAGRAR